MTGPLIVYLLVCLNLILSHTFVEIDYEIFFTVIFLPSAESFKNEYCQLVAKVCARSTGSSLPGKRCRLVN